MKSYVRFTVTVMINAARCKSKPVQPLLAVSQSGGVLQRIEGRRSLCRLHPSEDLHSEFSYGGGGDAGAYPMLHWAQTWVHTRWDASPLLGAYTVLDGRRKLEYPEEPHIRLGEHASSTHTEWMGF